MTIRIAKREGIMYTEIALRKGKRRVQQDSILAKKMASKLQLFSIKLGVFIQIIRFF